METYTRKLASIQQINGVYPIVGADRICQYGINGWRVVDQVGKYGTGDKVIFCEVDSWISNELCSFLTKPGHSPKEFNSILGQRLRTVKLRGALSQGLILPMSVMGIEFYKDRDSRGLDNCWVKTIGPKVLGATDKIGADVSEFLGIVKWELPPDYFQADQKGNFPTFLFKSDQERIQNCYDDLLPVFATETFEVQEKMEGQSHTVYFNNGEFGVCSRNFDLKDSDNTFWNSARKYDMETKLRALGCNIAVISEQCGPGIGGNIYKLTEHQLFVFDIFDIDQQEYLKPKDRVALVNELGLTSATVLASDYVFNGISCDAILAYADGGSVVGFTNTLREGLVFKANSKARVSFKAVSNKYLCLQK